jgi:hypothetical protein
VFCPGQARLLCTAEVPVQALAAELQATRPEFSQSLLRIWAGVNAWWAGQNRLEWFTDHSPSHSERVAEYASILAHAPLRPGTELSPLELYVLYAAALVHDLGMQFVPGSFPPLDRFEPEHFDEIRRRHPEYVLGILSEAPERFGLDPRDDRLISMISYVARAHGTQYFAEAVNLLRPHATLDNKPVRVGLLCALLLLADELDLSYNRATAPAHGQGKLGPHSWAHHFKHQCVSRVEPTITGGSCHIHLQLAFPADIGPDRRLDVRRWIVGKLQVQMGTVEREVLHDLDGQLSFDRAITTTVVDRLGSQVPVPPEDVWSVIANELAHLQLVNYTGLAHRVRANMASGQPVILLGEYADGGPLTGREDVAVLVVSALRTEGFVVFDFNRLMVYPGGAADDVLAGWLNVPGIRARREELLRLMAERISQQPGRTVLVIHDLDRLPLPDQQWLLDAGIVRWCAEHRAQALLTMSSVQGSLGTAAMTVMTMGMPDPTEVTTYFKRFTRDEVVALAEGVEEQPYHAVKQHAQRLATYLVDRE